MDSLFLHSVSISALSISALSIPVHVSELMYLQNYIVERRVHARRRLIVGRYCVVLWIFIVVVILIVVLKTVASRKKASSDLVNHTTNEIPAHDIRSSPQSDDVSNADTLSHIVAPNQDSIQKQVDSAEMTVDPLDDILESFKSSLREMGQIPHKIHISWPMKNLLDSKTHIVDIGVRKLAEMNPEWTFTVYDDDELEQYLRDKLDPEDYRLIEDKHIVEKTDLWRLLIIYYEGGLYWDTDRMVNLKMSEVLGQSADTKMLLPTHFDINFAQDIMCSAPGNPVHGRAIELNLEMRRKAGQSGVSTFSQVLDRGPGNYCRAAMEIMFGLEGRCLDGDAQKIRETLDKSPWIVTKKEGDFNRVCDEGNILFHSDDKKACRALQSGWDKDRLFREAGIKHWAQESRTN